MKLLHAKLKDGSDHWINPALYSGLEFSKRSDGGSVLCHYHGGTSYQMAVLNVDDLVREYQRMLARE